jgi:hypothetical protein
MGWLIVGFAAGIFAVFIWRDLIPPNFKAWLWTGWKR